MKPSFTVPLLLVSMLITTPVFSANHAVDNSSRPQADRDRDAGRHPAEIIEFMHITPGQTVLDLFAGGGYYTEILSYQVGSEGQVISHNNQAYLDYAKDELITRFADDRLSNVTRLTAEANDLTLSPKSIDTVMMVLSYHDLYFSPGDGSWPSIDGPRLLSTLCAGLKPGGVLGVIDHAATADSGHASGNDLHRIDPALAKAEIEASGCFQLEATSDVLRHKDDDLTRPMYDPAVRGKTDRFVFRFVKTAETASVDPEPR